MGQAPLHGDGAAPHFRRNEIIFFSSIIPFFLNKKLTINRQFLQAGKMEFPPLGRVQLLHNNYWTRPAGAGRTPVTPSESKRAQPDNSVRVVNLPHNSKSWVVMPPAAVV